MNNVFICRLVFTVSYFFLFLTSNIVCGWEITKIDGTPVKAGSPLPTNTKGFTYKAFSAVEDLTLCSDSTLKSPSATKLGFLQAGWVVEESPKNGSVLLATSNDGQVVAEPLGWVSDRDLLMNNRPLFAAPGVYKKCMIVNRIDQTTKEWDLVRLNRRQAIAKPQDIGSKEVRLSNVFFVYKESQDKKFVLLGTTESFSAREGPNESLILGWAPVERVVFWNTRFGFECDIASLKLNNNGGLRTTPVYMFRSVPLAQKYGAGGNANDQEFQSSFIFQEDILEVQQRKIPFFNSEEEGRFIVMGRDEGNGTEASLKEVLKAGQRKLYHVGVVGSLGQAKNFRERIKALRDSLRRVQIVFLMDKTEEMEPFLASTEGKISPIERTVGQILEDYRLRLGMTSDDGRDLEMSLSFYADEEYSERPFVLQKLVKVNKSGDLDKQMEEFRNVSGDGGGDAPDSLLKAIEQALKLFSPIGSKRRILIVIGTMGDKIGDNPELLNEYLSRIETTATASKPMPIEIYSIQVPTSKVLEGHPDALRFVSQMSALSKRLNESWQKTTSTKDEISNVTPADARQKLSQSQIIEKLCKKIQDRVKSEDEDSNEAIKALRSAAISGKVENSDSSMKAGEFLRARLEAAKIPAEQIPPEIFDEGYVWKESFDQGGIIPQVRAVVNVEKKQAENLLVIVRTITELGAFRVGKKLDLVELSNKVLDALAGDSLDAEGRSSTLSEYLRNRSLPFQSKVMEAISRGESVAITPADEKHLLRVKQKLEDIMAFRFRDYDWQVKQLASGESIGQWVPKPGSEIPISRFFSHPGDPSNQSYIWLDLATEIP